MVESGAVVQLGPSSQTLVGWDGKAVRSTPIAIALSSNGQVDAWLTSMGHAAVDIWPNADTRDAGKYLFSVNLEELIISRIIDQSRPLEIIVDAGGLSLRYLDDK